MDVNDLTSRAAKYDESLARDIADYVRGRRYGLVYEASKPEFVRLWNKPVVRGDLVNVLPPRGKQEDTRRDDDPFDIAYRLVSEDDGIASLRDIKSGEQVEAPVEDLVAIARFDQPIYCGLKETGRVERGGDKPYHVVINGENYHALQTLTYAYAGKVDCIYIDPPYNTGAKDWKYNNNYVSSDDTYRHSKWLTFMEDRLKVAKKLLNPKDSVLICTIDEKEYLRLGLLLEQLFPDADMQMVSIVINPSGAKRDNLFSRSDEYAFILLFGNASVVHPEGNSDETEVRWWYLKRTDYASRRGTIKGGPSQFYPIYVNDETKRIEHIGNPLEPNQPLSDAPDYEGTTKVFPIRDDGVEMNWGLTGPSLQHLLDEKVVRVSKGSDNMAYVFQYLSANYVDKINSGRWAVRGYRKDGSKVVVETSGKVTRTTTTWKSPSHDAGQYGTSLLHAFVGNREFSFPKSLYAVEDTLRYFVKGKPDALVVDFFAGSGTTAHAVMRLNHQDGGRRCSICITNNEVSARDAGALVVSGHRQGDSEWETHGICRSITIPRIVAAITGTRPDGTSVEGTYGIERNHFVIDDGDVAVSKSKFDTSKEIYTKKRNGYVLDSDDIIVSKKQVDTGKRIYILRKIPDNSVQDRFPMADGFEENAVFYDLTYLEPSVVSADLAFDEIAPILWLRGGCRGPVLHREPGYVVGETYAVLFDYGRVRQFIDTVHDDEDISHVFIVTDVKSRYRGMCAEFPDRDVAQLYESYLRSFEINVEE